MREVREEEIASAISVVAATVGFLDTMGEHFDPMWSEMIERRKVMLAMLLDEMFGWLVDGK